MHASSSLGNHCLRHCCGSYRVSSCEDHHDHDRDRSDSRCRRRLPGFDLVRDPKDVSSNYSDRFRSHHILPPICDEVVDVGPKHRRTQRKNALPVHRNYHHHGILPTFVEWLTMWTYQSKSDSEDSAHSVVCLRTSRTVGERSTFICDRRKKEPKEISHTQGGGEELWVLAELHSIVTGGIVAVDRHLR